MWKAFDFLVCLSPGGYYTILLPWLALTSCRSPLLPWLALCPAVPLLPWLALCPAVPHCCLACPYALLSCLDAFSILQRSPLLLRLAVDYPLPAVFNTASYFILARSVSVLPLLLLLVSCLDALPCCLGLPYALMFSPAACSLSDASCFSFLKFLIINTLVIVAMVNVSKFNATAMYFTICLTP